MNASDVVATPEGFVAVGGGSNPSGCGVDLPQCKAMAFTSPDGRTWERHDVKVPDGLNFPDALTDAVAAGGLIFAISHEADGQRQAPPTGPTIDTGDADYWRSADGLTWIPIEGIPADLGPSHSQPMAAGPDRLVIVGDLYGRIAVSPPK